MRKQLAITTTLLLAVSGVVIFVGSLPATSETGGRTIRLFEHDTQQSLLNLGGKDTSPGDEAIFAGDLFDHAGGMKIGRVGAVCTTISGTSAAAGDLQCTATFVLARGQITCQGLSDSAAFFGGATVPFAITGGTGLYRNARGEGTIQVPQDVPNLTDANFVLDLS